MFVIVIAFPPTKVNVSLFESATISDCPLTAIVLNIFCEEPKSVFVIVTLPLPLAAVEIPVPPSKSSVVVFVIVWVPESPVTVHES